LAKPGDILGAFQSALAKVLSSTNQDKIAKEMADTMRIRAQLGGSVESTGSKKKPFKKLSPGYVEKRKKDSKLSSLTSSGKSNITRTGQLIESISGKGKSSGFDITVSGSRSDSDLTNKQVADFVEEGGRPFLNFSDIELKKIGRLLEEQLVDEINKKLGK